MRLFKSIDIFSDFYSYRKWNIGGYQLFTKTKKVQTAETSQEIESETKEISFGNHCLHATWLCCVTA